MSSELDMRGPPASVRGLAPVCASLCVLLTPHHASTAPPDQHAQQAPLGVRTLVDPTELIGVLGVSPAQRAGAAVYDAAMLVRGSIDPQIGLVLSGRATTEEAVHVAFRLLRARHDRPAIHGVSGRAEIAEAIHSSALSTGVSQSYLWRTALRESGLDPLAAASRSTARGLFQFVEQTWLVALRRYGAVHGYGDEASLVSLRGGRAFVTKPALRSHLLRLRFDPGLSARLAGELAAENRRALAQALGRPVSDGEIYVAHFLGAEAASRLLLAARRTPAIDASILLPKAAASNPTIFLRNGHSLTAAQLVERLTRD